MLRLIAPLRIRRDDRPYPPDIRVISMLRPGVLSGRKDLRQRCLAQSVEDPS